VKRWLFAALCLALAAGFAGLGVWQVERRAWKLDLIAKVEARIGAPPTALPPRREWGGDLAYRRVRAVGRFLNNRETFVQAVTERGAGWWVMTPLVLSAPRPDVILVNRGFVPPERRDGRARRNPDGMVAVTGLIRNTEPGGAFLRSNDPASDRWYSRDVAAIARARGLAHTAPFFVDADATANAGGYPIGGLTIIAFRNNHLMYAITWFGLAALSLAGAVLVLRVRPGR
jgi:surfeit locus 1 family protein